jgi:nucleotide-binding universal stress UspA family protein
MTSEPTPSSDRVIIVGLDASPRAEKVLAAAVRVAQTRGERLVLVRAVSMPIELPHEALAMSPSDLPLVLQAAAEKELERVAATLPADLVAAKCVRIGTAWSRVCEEAELRGADLIVVGSHGYDGIDRLLGTTAAKVVNHAHCSVLVIR